MTTTPTPITLAEIEELERLLRAAQDGPRATWEQTHEAFILAMMENGPGRLLAAARRLLDVRGYVAMSRSSLETMGFTDDALWDFVEQLTGMLEKP